jgi:LEA14-like dessication related protein
MNPNSFGVPLDGIDWQLSINGARAMTGTVSLAQTIPARGVAPITTALRVDARDALAAASSLAGGGRAYELRAQLHFSTPVGRVDVAVEHAGTI